MKLAVMSPSTEIQKVPKHNFRHIQSSKQAKVPIDSQGMTSC